MRPNVGRRRETLSASKEPPKIGHLGPLNLQSSVVLLMVILSKARLLLYQEGCLRIPSSAIWDFQPCPRLAALLRLLLALAFQSLWIITGVVASSGFLLLTS